MQKLTAGQAAELSALARQAIAANLAGAPLPDSKKFSSPQAVFVTLKKFGLLRGCIGTFAPQPLGRAIAENAVSAAQDPRFPPVEQEELAHLRIEISILSDAVPLAYEDPDDLVKKISQSKPGLVLRSGRQCATFLPQVWNDLPEPAAFLSRLCQKAGLSDDAWKKIPLEISTYTATIIQELQRGE